MATKRQNGKSSYKGVLQWRLHPAVVRVWRICRPVLTLAIGGFVAYCVFAFAINYLVDRFISPVDVNDPTPIEFVVEKSDSASKIATNLYNACGEDEPGIISNTAVFKIYVDFVGKAESLKAGTYVLSKNMDIVQIVDIICAGNPPKESANFKVLEGYTISGVLYSLNEAKLEIDESAFYAACNDIETYKTYSFIDALQDKAGQRDYILEGYLFPDTYTVFVDADANDVITKMLVRFNEIFTDEYIARAEQLGMTIDEVIILASIIQREAAMAEDFPKVSAVFHNRLGDNQKLESCATLQYVLKVNKYQYNEEERATDSPYNTYLYSGLPTGPIGNPGKMAIEAALYPDEDFIKKDYRYFCNMDLPDNKALIFATTYEQHQKNVAKYQQYW
ncbi:MAG: endolytic transglycosylase MltG [Clostridiales bacterium]|jgi:UPF0755 protein|nr:endolytic transglycosylase MltG [Clostridiales bacterium]